MNVLRILRNLKLTTLFPLLIFASSLLALVQYLYYLNNRSLNTNAPRDSVKSRQLSAVCKGIIDGNKRIIEKANEIMKRLLKRPISPEQYINLASNCHNFKKDRGYILRAFSENEEEFLIAFGISIYKDIEQFERTLRAVYRPQNHYCIHIDKKSPKEFHQAVQKILSCFSNVFVASQIFKVYWGRFSVLQSDLVCMKDLLKRSKTWKYFINLTGQEFPLKTNNELVEMLRKLAGKSIVDGIIPMRSRYLYVHRGTKPTRKRKLPFRGNFTFYKGSSHVVLSRSFVSFILHNKLANDFLKWVKNTGIPDETYYATLYYNVDFDKDFRNNSYGDARLIRYKNWRSSPYPCHGKIVRKICINGIGDLKTITRTSAMFVNKFYLDYQYLALDCLEEWLYS